MRTTLKSAALIFFATVSAIAQTHYCIGGDLDALTPAEVASCKVTMAEVREAVRQHGAPNDWRFLVVCDEGGWQDVAAMTGQAEGTLRNADFQTDRAMQVTFLRRSRLITARGGVAGLLKVALDGLPSRETTPSPIPNMQQKREVPTLLLAEEQGPDGHRQDEMTSGQ